MTRQELVQLMALMSDEELEQCILIFRGGGTTLLKDYVSRLPEDLRELEVKNILNYIKQQHSSSKSTKSMDELIEEAELKNPRFILRLHEEPKMIEFLPEEGRTERGSHYLRWATTDNGAIVYPTIMEDEQGNLKYYGDSACDEALKRGDFLEMSPEEADLFTLGYKTTKYKPWFDKWEQLYNVEKKLQGGTLEKQIKLCKLGSILDQLKEQLPDSEVIDLISRFGIEDLLEGGLKNTGATSISITIVSNEEDDGGHKIPEYKSIEVGDKTYDVEIVTTPEEMEKGLGERKSMDKDKGMLFDFGEVQEEVTFNCVEMEFPIDIVFINDDDEVIRVAANCLPGKDLFTENDVRYVLEVNANSGIKEDDEFEMDTKSSNTPVMKVLAPDGSTLMELKGGERIFSRKNTKTLIKMAKRAEASNSDTDFKKLGNKMFKYIHTQDTNKPEYVEVPED